jgi:tetratricopeptide (TPR) repeat protein
MGKQDGEVTKNELLQSGFKHFSAENFKQSIDDFEAALKIDPEFDLALNALAQVYNKLGNVDKAIKIIKKLIQLIPDDPIAHTALSRLYVQKGMIKEAEDELALSNQLSSGI